MISGRARDRGRDAGVCVVGAYLSLLIALTPSPYHLSLSPCQQELLIHLLDGTLPCSSFSCSMVPDTALMIVAGPVTFFRLRFQVCTRTVTACW